MLSAIDGVRVASLCTKNRSRLEEMAFDELEIVPRLIRDFIMPDSLFCHVEQRSCAMTNWRVHYDVLGVAC